MDHQIIRSKMKKTKPLMKEKGVKHHIPDTRRFNVLTMERMLKTYSTIYIKPDKGRKGYGILRVQMVNGTNCEVTDKDETVRLPYREAMAFVVSRLNEEKDYLIQQGIDLATYLKRPFDIRTVMMRPDKRWLFTVSAAKLADKEDAVVTYIPGKTNEVPLKKALLKNDQLLEPMTVLQQVVDLSHRFAQILGESLPLQVIGFDFALDKQGRLWFLEANTDPDCRGYRKINDSLSYETYREARMKIFHY